MDETFSAKGVFALALLCLMIAPCCVQNSTVPTKNDTIEDIVTVTEAQTTTTTTTLALTTTTKATTTIPPTTSATTTTLAVSLGRANVVIANHSFNPENITVRVDTIITWVNNDSSEHQIISDMGYAGKSGGFSRQLNNLKSSRMYKGSTYSYRFQRAGNYTYHCNIYPNLRGSVQVLP